jgi:hypothetical protein
MNNDIVRNTLNKTPELEKTICPHCRKRGTVQAMDYMPEMSFRGIAFFGCPKCQTTLDRPVAAMPELIRLPKKPKIFSVTR